MLFERKTKKAVYAAWVVLAALIIVSMVLLYVPITPRAVRPVNVAPEPEPADTGIEVEFTPIPVE